MPDASAALRYRFGIFEADASTGELRRQGIRVRLNTQPFQLLCLLLERPGELLTREEIQHRLWPADTFVDYDHGVNSAINRIREALGDSAASPRFVETLARRGYRFIAAVEQIGPDPRPAVPASVPEAPLAQAAAVSNSAAGPPATRGLLAGPHELPQISQALAATLFILLQLMYLSFYIGALANLGEIQDLLANIVWANAIFGAIVVTGGLLIPARAFVVCAVLFRAPGARGKLLTLWRFIAPFDVLWAASPFLLLHHINAGLAIACAALLTWAPFVQRSLILMGAGGPRCPSSPRPIQSNTKLL